MSKKVNLFFLVIIILSSGKVLANSYYNQKLNQENRGFLVPKDYSSLDELKSFVKTYLSMYYNLPTSNIKVDEISEIMNDDFFLKNEENRQYSEKVEDYHLVDGDDNKVKVVPQYAYLEGEIVNLAYTFSIQLRATDIKNGKYLMRNDVYPHIYHSKRLLFQNGYQCKNYALRAEQYFREVFYSIPNVKLDKLTISCSKVII